LHPDSHTSTRKRLLEDKVAIVTGASKGIGRATAKLLAEEGAKITANYLTSSIEAESLREEITKMGGECLLFRADVSNAKEVKEMGAATVARFGTVDILVNNAGMGYLKRLLESTEEDWDRTIDVNLKGVYLCSKEVAPIMLKQKRGKIVNVASTSGMPASPIALEIVDYAAAKAGVIGLTRALAVNLAPYVNVNVVTPGMTVTGAIESMGFTAESLAIRIDETPLKRFGSPEEIAKAILFLSSSESDYVTGENLVVAGGRPMT
jgi:3-oxoacyl-[acyl-carrier protein] reductase